MVQVGLKLYVHQLMILYPLYICERITLSLTYKFDLNVCVCVCVQAAICLSSTTRTLPSSWPSQSTMALKQSTSSPGCAPSASAS